MLNHVLEGFGLRPEETEVYLTLLEAGPVTGGELARLVDIKRPTVYGYLERLIAAGLVNQSQRSGVKIFVAEPGEKIRLLYKRKIEELQQGEKTLDDILKSMERQKSGGMSRPRMQFYEGQAGMETALLDFLSYPGITVRTFWPFNAIVKATSEDFFDYITRQRIALNISTRGIWPHSRVVDTRRHPSMSADARLMREVRIAPPGCEADMAYRIYANKVLFSSSRSEGFCFIIESRELVDLMTMQHEVLWNVSRPYASSGVDAERFLGEGKKK